MDENHKKGLTFKEFIALVLLFAVLCTACIAFSYINIKNSSDATRAFQAKAIELAIKNGVFEEQDDIALSLSKNGIDIDNGVFSYDEQSGKVTVGNDGTSTLIVFENGKVSVVG